jgi:retron-type reverse transcriptase
MSKRYKNIYGEIANLRNAYKALNKTRLGKEKYKAAAIRFTEHETVNIRELVAQLQDKSYRVGPYSQFTVYEPKEREIYAPCFRDKILQHMVHSVLKHIYWPCFISDSYACIENKGTHACVERIGHFLRKAQWQYGKGAFIVKIDIRKFFYTIDREVLKKLLRKKIRCHDTLWLLDSIIDSSPAPERGLPLGNLTSQLFANIYLNELDQYVKRRLGVKYYLRYADDAIAMVQSKDEARRILEATRVYLSERLNLDLNAKKSKIFPIEQGVNAIGFKHHPTHRLLRNDCKKKVKRKLRAMPGLVECGSMTEGRAQQMIGSWYGHARYANAFRFIRKLEDKFGFLCYRRNKLHVNL